MSPYDAIADEYYDESHQTSRNFDYTSLGALIGLRDQVPSKGLVLEVGAGKGRSGEYLGLEPERVIQLDSSERMLALEPRESCALRIQHRAELLPFLDREFCCVASFLCDPFLGLNFFSEAYRVLISDGVFIATTPAFEWGAPLRQNLGLDVSETRFVTKNGMVVVPSILVTRESLYQMLERAGFKSEEITIYSHQLPKDAQPVSADISGPAEIVGCDVYELDILYSIFARR